MALDTARVAMGRSSNGHVRVWVTAEAMELHDLDAILAAEHRIPSEPQPAVAEAVSSICGWKRDVASRVWAAGPVRAVSSSAVAVAGGGSSSGEDERPTCLLIDNTSSVPHLAGARDSIIRAFFEVTSSGPLAGQQLRGVVFRIVDAAVHAESMHRSAPQVVPAASRALRGSFLLAAPSILEPTVTLQVAAPPDVVQPVFDFVAARGGEVDDVTERAGNTVVTAILPALQAMALDDLAELTSGRAAVSVSSGGWKPVRGDPLAMASAGSDSAAAAALSGTASASAVEGWGRVVRFDPPNPDRTAADAVVALRVQAGLSGPPQPAAAVADAVGSMRS
jgi:translation elongation factor EF-G